MKQKLLIINPNTSKEMTLDIEKTINKCKSKNIDAFVQHPDFGPESLESFYDYSLATFGTIRFIEKEKENYDGILIACFGDPGLYAIKEMVNYPVIGIAEASISISNLLGQKFAILVALDKAVSLMKDMVRQYGMEDRCAAIEPLNISVLDIEKNKEQNIKKLIDVSKIAIEKGAEVLILGCAGMTGMHKEIERTLNIPVIDPVECGYKVLEMMVLSKFNISKKGLYMTPPKKQIEKSKLLFD